MLDKRFYEDYFGESTESLRADKQASEDRQKMRDWIDGSDLETLSHEIQGSRDDNHLLKGSIGEYVEEAIYKSWRVDKDLITDILTTLDQHGYNIKHELKKINEDIKQFVGRDNLE